MGRFPKVSRSLGVGFGLGNETALSDQAFYKLAETQLPIRVDFPVFYGLMLSAQATALYAESDPSRLFISRFAGSSVPGTRSRTTYIVPGLSASYRSPDVPYGFSGEGRASDEAYEAVDGGKFTFDRVEARRDDTCRRAPAYRQCLTLPTGPAHNSGVPAGTGAGAVVGVRDSIVSSKDASPVP